MTPARATVVRVGAAEQLELWVTDGSGATHRFRLSALALATLIETGVTELATALRRAAPGLDETFSGVSGRPAAEGVPRG